jgi:antirestriction protein
MKQNEQNSCKENWADLYDAKDSQAAWKVFLEEKKGDFDTLEDAVKDFEESFVGEFATLSDFAERMINDMYALDSFVKLYFDFEKFGRDLLLGDYWEQDGKYFRML